VKTAKDIIKGGRLAERSVPVCMRADLVAQHEELDRQLQKAVSEPRDSLAAGSAVSGLSEQIRELEAEMAENTIDFRIRALPRVKYRALREKHPPRKAADDSVDQRDFWARFNTDTFWGPLLRASVVEPVLDDEDWAGLIGDDEQDGNLSEAQFVRLSLAAFNLNEQEVDVPFSAAALRPTLDSAPE
jgi:hypothetical protein